MNYSYAFLLICGSLCVFLTLVGKSTALSCYTCNSHNDSRCADTNPPELLRKECPKESKDRHPYIMCRKITQIIEFEVNGLPPDTRVIRGCGWDDSSYKGKCYHRSGFGGRQEVCACEEDNCNSAPGLSTTVLPLSIALVLLKLCKTKWKVSKQSLHRYTIPPQQMQPVPSPQMFFNNYPTNSVISHSSQSTPYESLYYGPQPYVQGGNVYRPQIQNPSVPSPQPPRPYVTITQFNYQPVGYSQVQNQPSNTNLVFGPPPRDRRCGADTQCRYYPSQISSSSHDFERPTSPRIVEQPKIIYTNSLTTDSNLIHEPIKRNDLKADSSTSFDFSFHPEQVVSSICEERNQDCFQCQNHHHHHHHHRIDPPKISEETIGTSNVFGTPRMWTDCEFVDPLRIEDDELTKFIVDGCMKAEAIAVRNQHRPCFKNIKHLCTRTRTDILKPRTTVANIHSQGIPWATKDFIFAFVRLINCWYILKGYLDDHEGSLGKIEQALTPEFKECYQRWQNINKEMVKHLINIFVNLDNGISVQNAEIFSSFNQARKIVSSCSLPCEDKLNLNLDSKLNQARTQDDDKSGTSSTSNLQTDYQSPRNIDSYIDNQLKGSDFDGKSVPGILRLKNMFSNNSTSNLNKEDDFETDLKQQKIYMKPGSYRVPKRLMNSPVQSPRHSDIEQQVPPEKGFEELNLNQDQVWKYALQSFKPFIKAQAQKKESKNNSNVPSEKGESVDRNNEEQTQDWVNDHFETIDDNFEDLLDQKPSSSRSKNSGKKTITSKTFRKRNDDSDTKCSSHGEFTESCKSDVKTVSSMSFLPERSLGLPEVSTVKFEKIINVLWHQKFARFVTFEVNTDNVPDYYKYISSPMFLYKVMNKLKQQKYDHPNQVVHDLRLIVRNAEIYVKNRPDWWFEQCMISFSNELESQLALEFSAIDFSSNTENLSSIELNIYEERSDDLLAVSTILD